MSIVCPYPAVEVRVRPFLSAVMPGGVQIGHGTPHDYRGRSIQRVDLTSGVVGTLYSEASNAPLRGGAFDVVAPGDDMMTAYVTLSGTGRLMRRRWARPGLRLVP